MLVSRNQRGLEVQYQHITYESYLDEGRYSTENCGIVMLGIGKVRSVCTYSGPEGGRWGWESHPRPDSVPFWDTLCQDTSSNTKDN
jgi:hypothetical protein